MDRQQASKVMGVNEDATKDEIIKKYNMLIKKHKNESNDSAVSFNEITEAYNLLMGYDFFDPEAEAIRKYKQENPNKILKKLKIDQNKFENFIYYHKWHIIASVLALAIIISIIVSTVTQIPSDLDVDVIGEIYNTADNEENLLNENIMQKLPHIKKSQTQIISIYPNMDAEMDYAVQTQITVQFAAGDIDLFILDELVFNRVASNGAFIPLEDLISSLGVNASEIGIRSAIIEYDELGNIESMQEEKIYGLDITGSKLLSDSGLVGDRMIAAIRVNAKHYDNAVELLKLLLE